MKFEKLTTSIFVVLGIVLFFGVVDAHENKRIRLNILGVQQRACEINFTSKGILDFSLKNVGTKDGIIPFFLSFGKLPLPKQPQTYYRISDKDYFGGGDFANLTFEWLNIQGEKVLADSYNYSREMIFLKSNQSEVLSAPIQLPVKPGVYSLIIKFDNQKLKHLANSHNIINLDKYFFFEASDQIKIEILPATKEESKKLGAFVANAIPFPESFNWDHHKVRIVDSWIHKTSSKKLLLLAKLEFDDGNSDEHKIENSENKSLFLEPIQGDKLKDRLRYSDLQTAQNIIRVHCIEVPTDIPKNLKARVKGFSELNERKDYDLIINFRLD